MSVVSSAIESKVLPVLHQLLPILNKPNNILKIAVAVSGGVDSMALVNLLKKYKTQNDNYNNLRIIGLTIDHRLREESSREAAAVSSELNKLEIDSEIIELNDLSESENGKIEEAARNQRYDVIQKYCFDNQIDHLLTGHHFDDQLETFLLRLNKRSTIFGLNSMNFKSKFPLQNLNQPVTNDLSVVRPLLNLTKDEIYSYCETNDIKWFEDPTNKDPSLTFRNWVRKHIINNENQLNLPQLLTKENLTKSLNSVQLVNKLIDNNVELLKTELKNSNSLTFDSQRLKLKIILDQSHFDRFMNIDINKFLFHAIEKNSPLANYHYAYTTIDSKDASFSSGNGNGNFSLAESLREMLDSAGGTNESTIIKNFSLLNCGIQAKIPVGKKEIHLTVSRENPRTPDLVKLIKPVELNIKGEWSNWTLYDNRIWFQFKINNDDKFYMSNNIIKPLKYYYLDTYDPKRHSALLDLSADGELLKNFESKDLKNLPILLNTNLNPETHATDLVNPTTPSSDLVKEVEFVCFPSLNVVGDKFKQTLNYEYLAK